jgi:hypothetical protein
VIGLIQLTQTHLESLVFAIDPDNDALPGVRAPWRGHRPADAGGNRCQQAESARVPERMAQLA